SDARANRFFGEQLDQPGDDGAAVSAGTPDAPDPSADEGCAERVAAPAASCQAEGGETQGEETGREEAAARQGEARRQSQTEEDGETASPLAVVAGPRRELLWDGWPISARRSRATLRSPRTHGGARCAVCGAR